MRIVNIDVEDGRGIIPVAVAGNNFEEERLKRYMRMSNETYAQREELQEELEKLKAAYNTLATTTLAFSSGGSILMERLAERDLAIALLRKAVRPLADGAIGFDDIKAAKVAMEKSENLS